ncbi:hypothetical protein B4098_0833 [Heyndrickxia coagulans]|uniref:Uncharacterized protein n=1 Tax=Heyndrickxia coagulans TaxID=1398 RepID=A0A150JNM3_HEYCO|nr:hypothetical protein B4098_0833 [Heyndrickxia coagulans]
METGTAGIAKTAGLSTQSFNGHFNDKKTLKAKPGAQCVPRFCSGSHDKAV